MPLLKIIKGPTPGQVIELTAERTILGRHPQCQVRLDSAAVSRQHAQITRGPTAYVIEDLRSRNGTQINGVAIRGATELRDQDQVQICDYVFEFHSRGTGLAHRPARVAQSWDNDDLNELADSQTSGSMPSSELAGSSILSSMDIGRADSLRINVKPEAKLKAILEISQSLGKAIAVDEVLASILKSLFVIFPAADHGFVLLKNEQTRRYSIRATRSRMQNADENIPVSMTIVRQAMQNRQAVLTADAADDRRFDSSESLADLQLRSVMCAPLLDQEQQALGVIQISSRDLTQQFKPDDLDLFTAVAVQAAVAVENATLHETLLQRRDLERELEFASQVQLGFLPSSRPQLPNYEFADLYEAAHQVGGDYFDYIPLPNGRLVITIGDVAGKGIPAALLMARLYASVRYHVITCATTAEAMTALNREFITQNLGFRFVTLAILELDPQRHQLTLVNAGHLPPLVRRNSGHAELLGLEQSGMPIGLAPKGQVYESSVTTLEESEAVLVITDGVTEAMDPENTIYGRQRLQCVLETGPQAIADLVPAVVADVEEFCAGEVQRDDMCLVGFRRLPSDAGVSTASLPAVEDSPRQSGRQKR